MTSICTNFTIFFLVLKGMVPVFTDSCMMMVDRWNKLASTQRTCEIDVWTEFQDLTGDIISRTAFGSSYEEGKKILKLQKELQVLVMEAMQTLYIPGFRYIIKHFTEDIVLFCTTFLPQKVDFDFVLRISDIRILLITSTWCLLSRFIPTKKNRSRNSLNKRITSMLRTLVEKKDRAITAGESRNDDLLGLLLQSCKQINPIDNASGAQRNQMTVEEIIEECKLFYLAGHETTSSWLTWIIVVLAMHQDWQEKAREEVLRVCGKDIPSFEGLSCLKFVCHFSFNKLILSILFALI